MIGLRGPSASPWAEPALEAAAALLAGQRRDPGRGRAARRPAAAGGVPARGRAGRAAHGRARPTPDARRGLPARDRPAAARARRGTLLVLDGRAARARCVEAALWAAPASAAIPRPPGGSWWSRARVPGLVEALRRGRRALTVGDPRDADADRRRRRRYADALAPSRTFVAPTCSRSRRTTRASSRRPTRRCSRWSRSPDSRDRDRARRARRRATGRSRSGRATRRKGERVARRLPSPTTWVGRHGIATTAVPTRIARHVVAAPARVARSLGAGHAERCPPTRTCSPRSGH